MLGATFILSTLIRLEDVLNLKMLGGAKVRKLVIISAILISFILSGPAFATESSLETQDQATSFQHIVKSGETLSGIASFHKVTMESIVKLNKITNPHKLQIGQTLLIPIDGPTPTQNQSQVNPTPVTPEEEKYIVKSGDTLSHIAGARGLSIQEIVAANKLSNPHALQIGQVLILPKPKQNTALASRSDERPREAGDTKDENTSELPEETAKLAENVIAYAKKFLGCRYSYGASGPKAFDCSGFTRYVYSHFNIDLPHNSASQSKHGIKVDKSNLQPGDLVFFKTNGKSISHVGIYTGNGNFIHASTGGRKVEVTPLSDAYYQKRYVTARRILK